MKIVTLAAVFGLLGSFSVYATYTPDSEMMKMKQACENKVLTHSCMVEKSGQQTEGHCIDGRHYGLFCSTY